MKNKKHISIAVLMLFSTTAFAQVGINTATPKATFDITASASDLTKTDGFIAPRLKGSELKAKDALYTANQDAAIVYVTEALAAADVTDITTNVTSIGYYYFDKTIGTAGRWTKFSYQEPWNVQGGSTPATINTQNIYQSGAVAINKSVTYDGVTETNEATDTSGQTKLDVFGSVRFGARQRGAVGINSIVAGAGNSGSGNNVAVFGGANTSNAGYSLVSGFNNIAGVSGSGGQIITGHNNSLLTGSGQDNSIFGYTNTVSVVTASLTSGSRNTVSGGSNSITGGLSNTISGGDNKLVVGNANTVTGGDNSAVFGSTNTTSAINGITTGSNNTNSGINSIVGGLNNIVRGSYAGAFGRNNIVGSGLVSNSGGTSVVFGAANKVNHILSFVCGYGNSLEGSDGNAGTNFVGGASNTLVGNSSWNFVTGVQNTLSGTNTFVSGGYNNVSGTQGSLVSGTYLITTNNNEIALGRYNLNFTNSFFTLGNGWNASSRSNLLAAIVDQTSATTIANSWIAIGSNTTVPTRTGTEKLKVYGTIQTAGASYPDYVFEDYFKGASKINSDYQFKSLYDTEKYIKNNNHLPGVTSIKDLEKTENGYSFNLTELSTQTLEKVEELYLHTIEQQKQIDELKEMVKTQQEQIKQLMK